MAATHIRSLVLGAVALFEPVNGYQVRRELLSWEVEDWAHIRPGSIYSVLTTLTGQKHLERHDLVDRGRDVAVYTITPAGRDELHRLLARALTCVDPVSQLDFHTALSMAPLLARGDFTALLEERRANLDRVIADLEERFRAAGSAGEVPPHVVRLLALWPQQLAAERSWLVELLDDVRHGALFFRGETSEWQPGPEDEGWQMAADRERYVRLLSGS